MNTADYIETIKKAAEPTYYGKGTGKYGMKLSQIDAIKAEASGDIAYMMQLFFDAGFLSGRVFEADQRSGADEGEQTMRPCVKCGGKPCLCEKRQAYTGDLMYFYSCQKCGYRTGYGVPGSRPNGISVTTEQAIDIACQKWEAGTTLDKEREEIRERFRSRGGQGTWIKQ